MQRYKQITELQKLRNNNLLYFAASLLFAGCSYWFASLICGLVALFFLWRLVMPTIYFAPAKRHAVVSLDLSGATKSVRFVRTNVGTYVPAIFTPNTDKKTVRQTTNRTAKKIDGGGYVLGWALVEQDQFTHSGTYKSIVIDDVELSLSAALVCYLCLLCRSDRDTIFDTVTLRAYLVWLQKKTYFAAALVRLALLLCGGLVTAYWLVGKLAPSPTVGVGAKTPQTALNTAVVYENNEIVKGVQHA